MTIIYIETMRKKQQNSGLTPLANQSELWYNQSITIEKKTRVPRTPVAFRREGFKRVNKDMQTNNNINTLEKKGVNTMKNALDILFGLVALLPVVALLIL